MFNIKYLITLLNEKWEPIKVVKLKTIPRIDEFIFIEEFKKYYRVVNVVYQIDKKEQFIVVIKEFLNNL